jgi:hypothetical protein
LDARTGAERRVLRAPLQTKTGKSFIGVPKPVAIRISGDGRWLAGAVQDKVLVWKLPSGDFHAVYRIEYWRASDNQWSDGDAFEFSPDGKWLALGKILREEIAVFRLED